jgi:hypothetical protein
MEVSGQLHAPLALALRKKPPVAIVCIGGWVFLKAGLEVMKKRKSLALTRNRAQISRSSSP